MVRQDDPRGTDLSQLLCLHFLEWRTQQLLPDQLVLAEEEVDHVARYFMSLRTPDAEIASGERLRVFGGAAAIGKIYMQEDFRDDPTNSRQPPHINSATQMIIGALDSSGRAGRVRAARSLLTLSSEDKARLDRGAAELRHAASIRGLKGVVQFGKTPLLVFGAPESDPYLAFQVKERALRYMLMMGLAEITAVTLTFNRLGQLVDVQWQFLRHGGLL
jgi:hypothetical protein